MIVAIDGWALRLMKPGGIPNYVEHLVRALIVRGVQVRVFVPFVDSTTAQSIEECTAGATTCFVRVQPGTNPVDVSYREWYDELLPSALRGTSYDVFHGTSYFLPHPCRHPAVITVHDLAFEEKPAVTRSEALMYYSQRGREDAAEADEVIAVSASTRNDILRYWSPVAPVSVIPLAPCVRPPDRSHGVSLGRSGDSIGVLLVAPNNPRKNLHGMLSSYALLDSEVRSRNRLVIANARTDIVWPLVSGLNLSADVICLPRVTNREMAELYSSTKVLLYLSYAEGFGLPVVEAMSLGVPVVCSDIAPLREVTGGAALLVPPDDYLSASNALSSLLVSRELRESVSLRGVEASRRFAWRLTADETVAAYQRVIEK